MVFSSSTRDNRLNWNSICLLPRATPAKALIATINPWLLRPCLLCFQDSFYGFQQITDHISIHFCPCLLSIFLSPLSNRKNSSRGERKAARESDEARISISQSRYEMTCCHSSFKVSTFGRLPYRSPLYVVVNWLFFATCCGSHFTWIKWWNNNRKGAVEDKKGRTMGGSCYGKVTAGSHFAGNSSDRSQRSSFSLRIDSDVDKSTQKLRKSQP